MGFSECSHLDTLPQTDRICHAVGFTLADLGGRIWIRVVEFSDDSVNSSCRALSLLLKRVLCVLDPEQWRLWFVSNLQYLLCLLCERETKQWQGSWGMRCICWFEIQNQITVVMERDWMSNYPVICNYIDSLLFLHVFHVCIHSMKHTVSFTFIIWLHCHSWSHTAYYATYTELCRRSLSGWAASLTWFFAEVTNQWLWFTRHFGSLLPSSPLVMKAAVRCEMSANQNLWLVRVFRKENSVTW